MERKIEISNPPLVYRERRGKPLQQVAHSAYWHPLNMEEVENTADLASTEAPCYPPEMLYLLVAIASPYDTLAAGRELLASLAH